MKTTMIAGLKVYDYNAKPDPTPTPPVDWALAPIHAAEMLDPAVGESKTIHVPDVARIFLEARRIRQTPEQIAAEHKARFNDESLALAISAAEKAQIEVYQIADQLLYEHEGPFYAYAACGGGGNDPSHYADGTPWAKRREILGDFTRKYCPYNRRKVV